MPSDPYRVLGVPRGASREAVHDAYLDLVRRYHPDLHPGDRVAEERLKALNAAYEILSDPAERAKYDRVLPPPAPSRPPPPRHRPPTRPATRGAYRSPHRPAAWRTDPDRLRRRETEAANAGPRTVLGRPIADEEARRRRTAVVACVLLVLLLGCCRLCVDSGQVQHLLTRRTTVIPAPRTTALPRRPTAVATAAVPNPGGGPSSGVGG